MSAELQRETYRLRKIVAFLLALALRPTEGCGFHEAIGGMPRTGSFSAARAMAIHEAFEGQFHLVLHLFAKTAAMRVHCPLPLLRLAGSRSIDLQQRKN